MKKSNKKEDFGIKAPKKEAKEKYVTVCPKCDSTDVKMDTTPAYVATGLINQFKQCNNCGHHGMLFPEMPISQVKKPKNVEQVKNKQLVPTAMGTGYFKFIIYILIPIIAILAFIGLLMTFFV
ncbi:MAG: hypothetical protein ABIJ92_00270 [Candidatus Aenigmatarchaeota archaeon]